MNITLPEELKHKIERFPEINWPGFVKKAMEHKVEELQHREQILKELEEEQDIIDWSVKLQRASRRGRFDELKKRGLI